MMVKHQQSYIKNDDRKTLPLFELNQLTRRNSNIPRIATVTKPNQSNQHWSGRKSVVNEAPIRAVRADLAAPIYYLAGPPMMVEVT